MKRRQQWAQALHLVLWLPVLLVPCFLGMMPGGQVWIP